VGNLQEKEETDNKIGKDQRPKCIRGCLGRNSVALGKTNKWPTNNMLGNRTILAKVQTGKEYSGQKRTGGRRTSHANVGKDMPVRERLKN